MDSTVQRMLEEIAVASPQYLRPEDWRRLYCFAVYVHMQKNVLFTDRGPYVKIGYRLSRLCARYDLV